MALAGCPDRNRGVSPDGAGLFFPAGTVLDPRVPVDEPARWMFVLNANSDLVYNAGTLIPVDLDRFFGSWMRDAATCFARPPEDETEDAARARAEACKPGRPPGSSKQAAWAKWPVVGDVGDELTTAIPCRHNAQKPQVVECEDTFFLEEDAGVQLGNFGTALRGWIADVEDPERDAKLLVAVRGDPSVTIVDLQNDLDDPDGPPVLRCGQGEDSGMYDPRRCAGDSLLRFIRNDPEGTRLAAEPANILATPGDPQVLVTHSTSPQVSLIDLGGQYTHAKINLPNGQSPICKGTGADRVCKNGVPAIVHTPQIFVLDGELSGGWGLARRPCFPGTDNVPALSITRGLAGESIECGRSLIYAGFRTNLFAARTFISEGQPLDADYLDTLVADLQSRIAALAEAIEAAVDPATKAALAAELADLQQQLARYEELVMMPQPEPTVPGLPPTSFDQRCLTSDEVSNDELLDDTLNSPNTRGAFLCDARLYAAGAFRAAAFDVGAGGQANVLGDIAFSADGNRMFAVQTVPGALVYIDTSLDSRGLTRDTSAGLIELCAQPTAMAVFADGANEYAAVTCYKPSELFVLDLSGVRVVANILLGTGPHAMTVDAARQYLYVANSLDKTISVVDISRQRATRFSEVARLGRQVPYLR